jgi:hypothetical protein
VAKFSEILRIMKMKKTHELWVDKNGLDTFCLAGKEGEQARSLLSKNAKKVWQVEAESHFEAMTKYYI